MQLSSEALWAMGRLNRFGYECYAVGGCVRDALLGKEPHDVDLATSATAEEMQAVFEGSRVIETGLKHGTLTVVGEHASIEITTYRGKDLQEDLLHRDFTINAMAYHPEEGWIDPFCCEWDLVDQLIRCTEEERFLEDPLRILRGVRFAATLGFQVEERTAKAMMRLRPSLKEVSVERIFSELVKLLMGKAVRPVMMDFAEIVGVVIPQLSRMRGFDQRNPNHCYDVLEHTLAVVEHTPVDPVLRLSAFFHDMGKPESFHMDENGVGHFYGHPEVSARIADETLARLRCDNQTRERVVLLVRYHDRPIEPTKPAVRRMLNRVGEEAFHQLMALRRADNMGQAEQFRFRQEQISRLEAIAEEIIREGECFSIKDLALNGRDLMAMGIKGKAIGDALQMLLQAVMDDEVANTREALEKYMKKAPGLLPDV